MTNQAKKINLMFLSWIMAVAIIHGQAQEVNDNLYIIELEGGSKLEAEINSWEYDKFINLSTTWSDSILLPASAIRSIVQKSTLAPRYIFADSTSYFNFRAHFITGNEGGRAHHINGIGLSASVGYRWTRHLSLGAGIGYDRFIWDSGENLIPLFGEYTCYLQERNGSLFFNLQAGYSFALKNNDFGIIEAKGGRLIYPSFGLRFGKGITKYTIDLGYKFQKAQFTYANAWSSGRSEQRIQYKRLTLRFGVLI